MNIDTVFGLPSHGKTTYAAYLAIKGFKKRFFGLLKEKYDILYTNINLEFPKSLGINIVKIDRDDFGKYAICGPRALILYDEASQSFDNRDFKNFDKAKIKYFNEVRHHKIDRLVFFVQKYDALDSKIKAICSRVYWVYRYAPFLPYFRVWKIPHNILLAKKADASKLTAGEIVNGYVRPNFFARLFCKRFDGTKYWKYFNSYEVDKYPPLPQARYNNAYIDCYIKTYGCYPEWEEKKTQKKTG